jgi:SAM-dependent methyltransferase
MVTWIVEHVPDKSAEIIDLGCGNGHLLLKLAKVGYHRLVGIDYAPAAVRLASALAKERGQSERVTFQTLDLIALLDDQTANQTWFGRFDVVLDKGTFDAISLHPDQSVAKAEGRDGPADLYVQAAGRLLKPDGVLLITSCNWTRSELEIRFSKCK